jgi:hypothetical protein
MLVQEDQGGAYHHVEAAYSHYFRVMKEWLLPQLLYLLPNSHVGAYIFHRSYLLLKQSGVIVFSALVDNAPRRVAQ